MPEPQTGGHWSPISQTLRLELANGALQIGEIFFFFSTIERQLRQQVGERPQFQQADLELSLIFSFLIRTWKETLSPSHSS